MTTINKLIANHVITASGFPAVQELAQYGRENGSAVHVSSLPPAVLLQQGINTYYALQFPRNAVYQSAQDIIDADLPVQQYVVHSADIDGLNTVIVSRHAGTVELLQQQYPDAVVLDSVTAEDIKGKQVIGTLPPHLVTECAAYTSVSIRNFDYNKDGDITGAELLERIIFSPPITLRKV